MQKIMDMEDKNKFQYSQASLQDFATCNRRFYYRYIERLKWPAVESSPVLANENFMKMGAEFHLLVQQYILGIDEQILAKLAQSSGLGEWWQNFIEHLPFALEDELLAEKKFIVSIGEHRVLAKFDLIVKRKDDRIIIFDWKTARKLPTRTQMAARWQSKVYPFVIAKMGKNFGIDGKINPEQIEFHYWYPQFPTRPEQFIYSQEDFQRHQDEIEQLIIKIESLSEKEDFQLTSNQKLCSFCVFRSLCERGTEAGNEIDSSDVFEESELDWEIDFEQVGEIAY
jgi:hypothetical protein